MFSYYNNKKMFDNIRITFGRYKGCKIKNLSQQYKLWLIENYCGDDQNKKNQSKSTAGVVSPALTMRPGGQYAD